MRPRHGNQVFVGIVRKGGMGFDVTGLQLPDMAHIVDVQEVIHGRDALQQGEEEDPPDEELDAQEHETAQGDDGRDDEYDQGNPTIGDIPGRQELPVPEQGQRLEYGEQQEQRREEDVQQAVRNEGDAQRDDDEAEQQDGEIHTDSPPDRIPFQPDHERDEDGRQHPGEFDEELRSHREEIIRGDPAGNHDGQGENNHAGDQGHLETVASEKIPLEELDFPRQEGDQRDGEEDRDNQVKQDEQRESSHHRSAPLALVTAQSVGAVFVVRIRDRLQPITPEGLEQGQVVGLPVDENLVLDRLVPLLGIVVGGFQEGGRLRIMRAVPNPVFFLFYAGVEQLLGVEDAAVPSKLTFYAQIERRIPSSQRGIPRECIQTCHQPAYSSAGAGCCPDGAQGIPPVPPGSRIQVHHPACAVPIPSDLGRRKTLEGMDQPVVSVNVDVQAGNDVIERQFPGGKLFILARDLVQGIGHVERVVLLLRVEHQGKLVTPLHHRDQPFVLHFATLLRPRSPPLHRLESGTEFRKQHSQGLLQVLLIQHGIGGHERHQRHDHHQ